jgi:hypothetical protein
MSVSFATLDDIMQSPEVSSDEEFEEPLALDAKMTDFFQSRKRERQEEEKESKHEKEDDDDASLMILPSFEDMFPYLDRVDSEKLAEREQKQREAKEAKEIEKEDEREDNRVSPNRSLACSSSYFRSAFVRGKQNSSGSFVYDGDGSASVVDERNVFLPDVPLKIRPTGPTAAQLSRMRKSLLTLLDDASWRIDAPLASDLMRRKSVSARGVIDTMAPPAARAGGAGNDAKRRQSDDVVVVDDVSSLLDLDRFKPGATPTPRRRGSPLSDDDESSDDGSSDDESSDDDDSDFELLIEPPKQPSGAAVPPSLALDECSDEDSVASPKREFSLDQSSSSEDDDDNRGRNRLTASVPFSLHDSQSLRIMSSSSDEDDVDESARLGGSGAGDDGIAMRRRHSTLRVDSTRLLSERSRSMLSTLIKRTDVEHSPAKPIDRLSPNSHRVAPIAPRLASPDAIAREKRKCRQRELGTDLLMLQPLDGTAAAADVAVQDSENEKEADKHVDKEAVESRRARPNLLDRLRSSSNVAGAIGSQSGSASSSSSAAASSATATYQREASPMKEVCERRRQTRKQQHAMAPLDAAAVARRRSLLSLLDS